MFNLCFNSAVFYLVYSVCSPPNVTNGQINANETDYEIGDGIIVTCNARFYVNGGSETTIQLICRNTGLFTSYTDQTIVECLESK